MELSLSLRTKKKALVCLLDQRRWCTAASARQGCLIAETALAGSSDWSSTATTEHTGWGPSSRSLAQSRTAPPSTNPPPAAELCKIPPKHNYYSLPHEYATHNIHTHIQHTHTH